MLYILDTEEASLNNPLEKIIKLTAQRNHKSTAHRHNILSKQITYFRTPN
jgi:hypothetical protein